MKFTQVLLHEIMAYEKFNGKKPKYLLIADKELQNMFFSEAYEFTMKTEGADFKTPGSFMGVKFIYKSIHQYGGSCKWMLVGDD